GTISERQNYRRQAVESVAKSYAGPQSLVAPVIVVPYRVEANVTHVDDHGQAHTTVEVQNRQWLFFPGDGQLHGDLLPAIKRRGLHEVRVYEMAADLSGSFDIGLPSGESGATLLDIGRPILSFGISDVRGLVGTPRLLVDNQNATLLQGSGQA